MHLSADAFYDLCQATPDAWLELRSDGSIVSRPHSGSETSFRRGEASSQLATWAREHGGIALGAKGGFALPDGSVMSPKAAWIARERIAKLTPRQVRNFVPLAPDFVVEVLDADEPLAELQAKLGRWMRNGVKLGWLIDGDRETVHIYRPGAEPETVIAAKSLAGEGPVAGFTLDLRPIWQGL